MTDKEDEQVFYCEWCGNGTSGPAYELGSRWFCSLQCRRDYQVTYEEKDD